MNFSVIKGAKLCCAADRKKQKIKMKIKKKIDVLIIFCAHNHNSNTIRESFAATYASSPHFW